MSKALSNLVMETVDPEITASCADMGAVKKMFQLALLCTKKQPSDRPTMHEVSRVLGCLVGPEAAPPATTKHLLQQQTQPQQALPPASQVPSYADALGGASLSASDGQLFRRFGEVISQNSE